jgi:hypothetical protein
LLATAKNYADADDAKKIIKEDVGGSSCPEHLACHDDNCNDRGQNDSDRRNDNCNFLDNRDRRHDRRNAFRGKRPREDDREINAVKKPSGHRDYQEDYNKALKGPCQIHPKANHTMENCRFLRNIYANQLANDDALKAIDDGPWHDGDDDDDDAQDVKVSLESKRERKLLKRACLSIVNIDDLISDPRLLAWSHREISFS